MATIKHCSPISQDRVSYCVFTHPPGLERVLAAYNITRCRPQGIGPSVFTNVCSIDSQILTGLRPCKLDPFQSFNCPSSSGTKSDRMVLDNTTPLTSPDVSLGEYLFPPIIMPTDMSTLSNLNVENASPHFRALWSVLQEGVRDLVYVLGRSSCEVVEALKDDSLADRVDFFRYVIEIITFSMAFHGLPLTKINEQTLLGSIAVAARDTVLTALNDVRPTIISKYFIPASIMDGSEEIGRNTPLIDHQLKSIYRNKIRANMGIVLSDTREDRNEQPLGNEYTSPIRVLPACDIKYPPPISNLFGGRQSVFQNRPVITWEMKNVGVGQSPIKTESEA